MRAYIRYFLVLVIIISFLAVTGASALLIDFEDLAVGQTYEVGGSFTTRGVVVEVEDIWVGERWDSGGSASIVDYSSAGGSGNEVRPGRVNLNFLINTNYNSLTLKYGEYGGSLNISINGDFRYFDNFVDIDGETIGNTSVTAIDNGTPGQSTGELTVAGTISSFKIGGAELYLDDINFIPEPGTVLLVGLGGLAVMRKRKRANKN